MASVLGGAGSRKDVSDFSGTKSRPTGGHDLRDRREALQQEQGKKEWGFDQFGNMVQHDIPLTRADVMGMMPDLVRRHMPQPLKGLLETTFEVGIDPLEMVATMQTNGSAAWTKVGGGSGNPGPWDYTIDQDAGTVRIEGGWIFRGKRTPLEVTAEDVAVNSGTAADPCWAYLEYYTTTGTAAIIATCLSDPPQSETGIYRVPLHTFYMDGTTIVFDEQQQFGAIKIDGMFA
jgi:hypothetical protein